MLYVNYQNNKYLQGMVEEMLWKVAIYESKNRSSISYGKTCLSKSVLGISWRM